MSQKTIVKLLICFTVSAVIASSLSGCSFGVISSSKSGEATTLTDFYTTKKTTEATTNTTSTTSTTASTTTTEKPTSTTTTTTTTKPSTTKKTTTAAAKTTTKKTTTAAAKTTTKKTKKVTKTTVKSNTLTITINCSAITENAGSIRSGYEKYVPKNGYLIKSYPFKYKSGDTVYSALHRACRETGIKIEEKDTQYGKYIVSLNSLDESVLGEKAGGWTYKVNGEMPMKSVDKLTLKNNDKIEFIYVKLK